MSMVLDDDPKPVAALAAERIGERTLDLILAEGRYHQLMHMLAAVGNQVEALHRSAFGPIASPADLAPGRWRDAAETSAFTGR